MLTGVLLVCLAVIGLGSKVRHWQEDKRLADERRRQSMREVTEKWHFREWERDMKSSDSL